MKLQAIKNLIKAEKYEEALVCIGKELKLREGNYSSEKSPENIQLLDMAAGLLNTLERYDQALNCLKKAESLSPIPNAKRTQWIQSIEAKLKQNTDRGGFSPVLDTRYAIWIAPILIMALYYLIVVIINFEYPVLLALLTTCLYFYAVYPLEIEKIHTLKEHFYNQKKNYFTTYIMICCEVFVIAITALKFSCDCSNNQGIFELLKNTDNWKVDIINNLWIANFCFLYLCIIFLWVQTNGLTELKYGLRKFYFKTSLFIGLVFSAYTVYLANLESLSILKNVDGIFENLSLFKDDLFNLRWVKGELLNPSSWRFNTDHFDNANDYWGNIKLLYPNLTEVWENSKSHKICELLDFFNKISNSVANKFFTTPFNYILLMIINFNIIVGFIFSIHIIAVVRVYKSLCR